MPQLEDLASNFISVLVGTGALFGVIQLYSERRKRKEAVKYLATRIAIQLEGYAIDCANKVSDYNLLLASNGILGELVQDIPILPEIPDGDYKLLDRSLLDNFLQLPQNIKAAHNAALRDGDFVNEVEGIQDTFRLCD